MIVILRRHLVWSSIYLGSSFPNDLLLIAEEPDVVRIVESSIPKKKLASMKSMLESSLRDLKRSHADTADSYLKEIKKLKFDEPHRFKKKGNEDQYRFNLRVGDAIEEAKKACSSQFFQVSACSMTSRRSRRSRTGWRCCQFHFASNDLSDNCHDEISHSNDLDAVVESESHCQIMSLPQVNRIFLRFVVVSHYGTRVGKI